MISTISLVRILRFSLTGIVAFLAAIQAFEALFVQRLSLGLLWSAVVLLTTGTPRARSAGKIATGLTACLTTEVALSTRVWLARWTVFALRWLLLLLIISIARTSRRRISTLTLTTRALTSTTLITPALVARSLATTTLVAATLVATALIAAPFVLRTTGRAIFLLLGITGTTLLRVLSAALLRIPRTPLLWIA